MNKETLLATFGCYPDEHRGAVNLPTYRASTILFPNLASFEAAERGEWPHSIYGRYGTRTSEELETAIAQLENADHAIVTSSGLAAITTALMSFLKAGDHLLMVDSVYGPTRRMCDNVLKRLGVEVTYYDPLVGAGIAALIKDNTRVVYVESPGSLTFEVQDVPAIAKAAHAKGAIVIGDMTWGTPLFTKPFEMGVDVSVHSATKYMSGHSDLVMGTIACKKEHYKALLLTFKSLGCTPGSDNCTLAFRGLRTMAVRVKQQYENALTIAKWLKGRPEVEEVLYPALPGAPGHDLWKRDFTGATSLFGVALKPAPHDKLAAMIDGLEYFGLGYSWGGFESLITTFSTKTRNARPWPYQGQGIRLHIGLEHADDLIKDLEKGFARLGGKS
jgi:cysteine-S-conjugate beta-lyase